MKLIVSTSPPEEADRIAKALVREKLVACVNVVPGVKSHYWWKGRIESARECVLLMKTTPALVERALARLVELHPYEVPEGVVLEITGGLPDYLAWIEESKRGDSV